VLPSFPSASSFSTEAGELAKVRVSSVSQREQNSDSDEALDRAAAELDRRKASSNPQSRKGSDDSSAGKPRQLTQQEKEKMLADLLEVCIMFL
jgi:hypothetical protein